MKRRIGKDQGWKSHETYDEDDVVVDYSSLSKEKRKSYLI
jgi:hypothetical protein